MSEPNEAPLNPMRAAQANMRPQPVRRFYQTAGVTKRTGALC